jgi:putative ABC transport system permease protein
VIISAGFARAHWPNGDALGARVRPNPLGAWSTVVGVVGDVRMGGAGALQPSVYTSQRQDHWRGASEIVVRAQGDPVALMSAVRAAARRVDPTLVIPSMRTLGDVRASTPAIADRRLQMQLITVFALVALIVSAIGVYGVGAYATEARRREFGIRMALGATPRRVLTLAMRDGALVAMVGTALGVPAALGLASLIRDSFYEVKPFDPLTVGVVVAAMLVVVFVASLLPARRATLVDPVSATRSD